MAASFSKNEKLGLPSVALTAISNVCVMQARWWLCATPSTVPNKIIFLEHTGTLWNQTTLTPGVIDFILYVKKSGRRCILLTNNSRKSNEQYYEKCRKLGLPVEKSDIICVAQVAANALLKTGMQGPLYVIGEEGIAIELSKVGISSLGIGASIQNVLVGYDSQFNYVKCMKAATLIGRGCKFYATNEDAQLPAPDRIWPGTGSVVAAVRVASGKDPIVFGKPHKAMFDYLVETAGICAEDTAMVGDR
ncbi:unnamed protein product [Dibothriocephalus latus]|uniref:Phosphoglycolate phosphatase n=1 Tax=Dibothriocephalus latus TaxID=60516 RepID=A0A3P7LVX9_DIBLA|nr:unnamed protein product [Dibothriocephalus latus]